jgi:HK97 family phage major capsid protein
MTVSITPKGQLLGRFIKALILGKGDLLAAHAYAMGQGAGWAGVAESLKGAVAALATSDASTSLFTPVSFDFSEALRPATLLGRIVGTRRVPFNLKMIETATGGTSHWVGEAAPKPLHALDFDSAPQLAPTKLASLSVHTQEAARFTSPAIEGVLAADAIAAAAQAADLALVSPDNAGSANKPASITNGATAITSTGTAIANVDADLRAVIAVLTAANIDLSTCVWLMAPRSATYMATLRGTGGAPAFPGLGPRGGKLLEMPVLTSAALMDESSPTEASIVLLSAAELLVADDGASRIEISTETSIEMQDADSITAGAAQLVSAWQHGLAVLRAERTLNFKMRHATGAAYIQGCAF